MRSLPPPTGFPEWRTIARGLLHEEIHPRDLLWQSDDAQESLFSSPKPPPQRTGQLKVPPAFLKLAETTACHRSGEQWALLYALLWRLTHGEPHLLSLPSDPLVHRVHTMEKHIRRDCHKMHAFVRFRMAGINPRNNREHFLAWFEPDHKIVRLNATFFRKRFTNMDWSILTPDECMHWDGKEIRFTPGVSRNEAPGADPLEELWRSYYKSIFNVSRLKVKAMQAEMPKKYWKNLPEAELIEELIATSAPRTESMLHREPSPLKPAPRNAYLERLKTLPGD